MRHKKTHELYVIAADMLGACDEAIEVAEWETARDAYGPFGSELWAFKLWWVDTFINDPEERRRIRAAMYAIEGFFKDLERLHNADSAHPIRVPRRLITACQDRVLRGMRPSVVEIANGATDATPARAVRAMHKYGVFDG